MSAARWWLGASCLCSREPQQRGLPPCMLPLVTTRGARSLPSAQTPPPSCASIWQLAHCIHADEPLVKEWGARPGIRISATRADSAHQARGGFDGQHHRQGPSRWYGCVKKNGPQAIGKSRGGWTTKIHMVAADARTAVTFSLSPGQAHDAPEGRKLLTRLGSQGQKPFLIMDRAYEGNETRQLALALGFTPVVPPLSTRVDPWEYDREMYKRRNSPSPRSTSVSDSARCPSIQHQSSPQGLAFSEHPEVTPNPPPSFGKGGNRLLPGSWRRT